MIFVLYRYLRTIGASLLVTLGLPPHSCRFTPSCSQYCEQAVKKHGLWGYFLCVNRIIRCHPFTPATHDPVP